MKYIIFSDIDGTLYNNIKGEIPCSSIKAIQKARENGHKIFICTGRCVPSIPKAYFDLPVDGFVLGCGSHILYEQNTIYKKTLPENDLIQLLDLLTKNDIGFMLEGIHHNYLFSEGLGMLRRFERNRLGNHLSNEELDILMEENNVFNFSKINEYHDFLKLTFYTSHDTIYNILKQIPSSLQSYCLYDKSFGLYSGEITCKDISKASGIDVICELLDSSLSQTMAIGDGHNDLEMIEHAAIGIAMGNACIELKEKADYITDSIDHDGFEKAFKHYDLI